ncbi:MAG TPA: Uma2 family endonuclease [Amycolatopsis sp.]|uniref:Uma2 family endonuclease n=1 Tax=Amycolatopsis sp. TaxID=37632 RepID=UPI002B478F74|nr:Uma2 family endonuclease [Amycolatopsis sp.]HKS43701.1 Uma2 family endonuclease [Amycolatopsis sp.]
MRLPSRMVARTLVVFGLWRVSRPAWDNAGSAALVEHVGPWTIADVEALSDAGDHSRFELLTPGVLTVSPAPGTVHLRVCRRSANLLDDAAVAAGAAVEVLEAVNVEIAGGRLAVPDIAVVDGGFAATDPTRYLPGTVLAVVEVVSPSTHPQDRVIKPGLYADTKIPVYWRVEIESTPQVIVSELRGSAYVQTMTISAGRPGIIAAPFPLEVDPAALVRQ